MQVVTAVAKYSCIKRHSLLYTEASKHI